MSIKGGNTLFNDIFPTEAPAVHRRGRSFTLDTDRNDCLISRYYYFGIETGLRYELLIKIVSRQFWLSEVTVYNILTINNHLLQKVRKEKPTKTDLRKKWPHMSWELPDLKDYI